jgi:hypothetical protein
MSNKPTRSKTKIEITPDTTEARADVAGNDCSIGPSDREATVKMIASYLESMSNEIQPTGAALSAEWIVDQIMSSLRTGHRQ